MSNRLMRASATCAVLATALLLPACSDGIQALPDSPKTPAISPPAPADAGPLRTLNVSVTDGRQVPLAGATVTFFNASQTALLSQAVTGPAGTATFETRMSGLRVFVHHDLGHGMYDVTLLEGTSQQLVVRIAPAASVTPGILPARIVPGSLSADRTEVDVALRVFIGADRQFQQSSYAPAGSTPLMRVEDCWIWLEARETTPRCRYDAANPSSPVSITWDQKGSPVWLPAPRSPSVLLMLEQSDRALEYDPASLRWNAAHGFLQRIGNSGHAGTPALAAVAGFSTTSGSVHAPLQLAPPAWQEAHPAAMWHAGVAAWIVSLQRLESPGTGEPAVLQGLRAATALLAEHAPAGDRAIIALLGGSDNSLAGSADLEATALHQQQRSASIRTILIAGRLPEESVEREHLAQLAARLDAPLIFAGYPSGWRSGGDGLYDALTLASDIVRGVDLPSLHLVVRLRTDAASPFVSGMMLNGTVYIESDQCPMGCAEIPLAFATVIP